MYIIYKYVYVHVYRKTILGHRWPLPRLPPRPGRLSVHQRVRVRRQHHLFGFSAGRTGLLVGARLTVPDQHGHGHPPGRRQRVGRGRRVMVHVHALLLLRPFRLVPVVLEPDFHLKQRKRRERYTHCATKNTLLMERRKILNIIFRSVHKDV